MNSSKLAEFAKDALGGGNSDLESRLAAFRKNEVSPRRTSPKMKGTLSPQITESTREGTEIWDSNESREKYSHEIWEIRDSRDSRNSRSSEERRDIQEIRDFSWERESGEHREYISMREHRNSRSSRDSRDSRDGVSESRELYRSSSRDRSVADWDYSHKTRDREYSHSSSASYDVPTPVPPPKVFSRNSSKLFSFATSEIVFFCNRKNSIFVVLL